MDKLEYIDQYFNHEAGPDGQSEFEKRIVEDPSFASDAGFYLSARIAAKELAVERFRTIYEEIKREGRTRAGSGAKVRRLWPYISVAASVAAIILVLRTLLMPVDIREMADHYIKTKFQTFGVTMGSRQDSLETGKRLYEDGRIKEAQRQFETIVRLDPASADAIKYAGIVSLRLGEYDKALSYFIQLEEYRGLEANPGKFYHAITLMERNRSGDKEAARQLLETVVGQKLAGRQQAGEWLKKF